MLLCSGSTRQKSFQGSRHILYILVTFHICSLAVCIPNFLLRGDIIKFRMLVAPWGAAAIVHFATNQSTFFTHFYVCTLHKRTPLHLSS